MPRQIFVRAKDGKEGNVTVILVQKDNNTSPVTMTIPPSSPHTLDLSCIDTSCGFELSQDEDNQSKMFLVISGLEKFIVKGHGNMEWSKHCTEMDVGLKHCTETDDGSKHCTETDDGDGWSGLWVLAPIAAGVAVTGATICVCVWRKAKRGTVPTVPSHLECEQGLPHSHSQSSCDDWSDEDDV